MDGDSLVERRTQDVEPIIEQVKRLRVSGETQSKDMWHVARIPHALLEAYLLRNGITLHEFEVEPQHLGRMLNDPDLAHFRIKQGAV